MVSLQDCNNIKQLIVHTDRNFDLVQAQRVTALVYRLLQTMDLSNYIDVCLLI